MDLTSVSVIKELLERHDCSFQKSLGQNFLINPSVPEKISVEGTGIPGPVDVIEIGPGIGCLTKELALRARQVFSFEIDKKLLPVLDESLSGLDNVTIINQDFMKVNIDRFIEEKGLENVCICANLPYYITTPIIMKILEESEKIKKITVMVQKEVADRFCSKPGTATYGAITASISYYADIKKVFGVSSSNFIPRPKVDSEVISLIPHPPVVKADKTTLFRVIKAAFAMRRKTLVNNLCSEFSISRDVATEMVLSVAGDDRIRGEKLSLEQYGKLADQLFNLSIKTTE